MAVSIANTGTVTAYGASPVVTASGKSFVVKWSVDDSTSAATTCLPYRNGKAYTWDDLAEAWYDGASCHVEAVNRIQKGRSYDLPDGARLIVDAAGNYRIEDQDAKVTYKANRNREFSPHLNASDLLAQFVRYVGSLGVRQSEVLGLPIELFINWLVIEAAERDQDPVPREVVPVAQHRQLKMALKPRCLVCQQFIPRLHHERRFPFCGVEHGVKFLERREQRLAVSC